MHIPAKCSIQIGWMYAKYLLNSLLNGSGAWTVPEIRTLELAKIYFI
jgi:hypothetical protein